MGELTKHRLSQLRVALVNVSTYSKNWNYNQGKAMSRPHMCRVHARVLNCCWCSAAEDDPATTHKRPFFTSYRLV
jgi:hypothetical protein